MGVIKRGLLAGAAGTTVLNAVTYLDMAVRGRPPSDTPERSVGQLLDQVGAQLPGDGAQREHRRSALGALSGIASGLGLGVAFSEARAAGIKLSGPVGAVVKGAAAMAATNAPMAAAGISDPRQWSAADWVSDALPHLAYGATAQAVISAQPLDVDDAPPPGAGLLARSFGLGAAAGMRSSLGFAAPGLFGAGSSKLTRTADAAAVTGEVVVDKLPQTPSRLEPPGLAARFAGATTGATKLARSADRAPLRCALAAAAGAAAGAWGGAAWRDWAGERMPALAGALIEDGVALTLGFVTCRGS